MRIQLENLGTIHDLINDETWTKKELAEKVRQRVGVVNRYMGPDENCFVIAHGNSPSFFADLFAVWTAGGCAVCVSTGLTPPELDTVAEFVGAKAILVNSDGVFSHAAPVIRTDREKASPSPADLKSGSLDDPALILFTSGTTGDPKGVVHSFRSILARTTLNRAYIGDGILARSLCVLPTHFGHGLIGNCLTPLLQGNDIFLMHGAGITVTAKLGQIIDTHNITFLSSVPAFWKVALKLATRPAGHSLKRVHIGSAPLSADLWQKVVAWTGTDDVANMYGITETANWIGGASACQMTPEDGLLGSLWGGQAAVLDNNGNIRNLGKGEILLQTPSLMTGYYQRPDLTREVLQHGWYHTGDMGSIDENGILRMTGRNRYVINKGGIKIYPEELDLLLEGHPDIQEACAFGLKDDISGETVGIAVSVKEDANISDADLDAWIRERIRPDAVPGRIFKLNDIPKTDRGKLNRDTVAQHCLFGGES